MEGTRRSMSQALRTVELPLEARALIEAGTPRPQTEHRVFSERAHAASGSETKEQTAELTEAVVPPVEVLELSQETEGLKPARAKPAKEKHRENMAMGGFVSASFRLPLEIPNALLRAAVDRKVKRQSPFTQQDIVAEALWQWLRKNGYAE